MPIKRGFGFEKPSVGVLPVQQPQPEEEARVGVYGEATKETRRRINAMVFMLKQKGEDKATIGVLLDRMVEEYWAAHTELHVPGKEG